MDTERPDKPSRLKAMLLVVAVSLGAGVLITGTFEVSQERIVANERARLIANLTSVVDVATQTPPEIVEISAGVAPASENVMQVFALRENSRLIAWVYSAVAPAGYNGPIEFLLGMTPGGDIIRIRIIQHRETPGLGDAIEADKSDWLQQFESRNLQEPERWLLEADGGEFDALTGATVTPRAMVAAIEAVLQYHAANESALQDTATGNQ